MRIKLEQYGIFLQGSILLVITLAFRYFQGRAAKDATLVVQLPSQTSVTISFKPANFGFSVSSQWGRRVLQVEGAVLVVSMKINRNLAALTIDQVIKNVKPRPLSLADPSS